MLLELCVGYQVFGNDEYHRAARKREKPRLKYADVCREIKSEKSKDRFDNSAERTQQKVSIYLAEQS